jgi:predicted dehydrogenase
MNRKDKFGIGIVGAGIISAVHADSINSTSHGRLVSVYSRNLKNTDQILKKYNIKAFDDWDKFITDHELDVVSVCTPSGTHLDYGNLAAKSGKHVVVEKPIEVDLKRAQQLIKVCKNYAVKLAIIYQNRFLPDVQMLKRKVDKGDLGKLFLADAHIKWFRTQAYYDSAAWRGTFSLDGGGVLINQAIHTIDLLQWIVGKVDWISAQTGVFTHQKIEGEDTAVAIVRFQNGAIGVIEGSTSVVPAQDRRLEIHGEKGTAILEGDNFFGVSGNKSQNDFHIKKESGKFAGASDPLQNFSIEPHRAQFEVILDAIKRGDEPPVSGAESLESLAIVKAIYESVNTGKAVNVRDFIKKQIL